MNLIATESIAYCLFHWKISDMKRFCKYFCYLNLKNVFSPVFKLGTDMRYCLTTAYFFISKRTHSLLSDFKDGWNQKISETFLCWNWEPDKFSLRRLLLSLNLQFQKLVGSDLESVWIKIPKCFYICCTATFCCTSAALLRVHNEGNTNVLFYENIL